MKYNNKNFLDTNRHHLERLNTHGDIRHLQVERMRQVMLEEFQPKYGPVEPSHFPHVEKLIRDVYAAYDKWLSADSQSVNISM